MQEIREQLKWHDALLPVVCLVLAAIALSYADYVEAFAWFVAATGYGFAEFWRCVAKAMRDAALGLEE